MRVRAVSMLATVAFVLVASGCGRSLPSAGVAWSGSEGPFDEYPAGTVVGQDLVDSLRGHWDTMAIDFDPVLTFTDDTLHLRAHRHGIWPVRLAWTYSVVESRVSLRDTSSGEIVAYLAAVLDADYTIPDGPLTFVCIVDDCGSGKYLLDLRWRKFDPAVGPNRY